MEKITCELCEKKTTVFEICCECGRKFCPSCGSYSVCDECFDRIYGFKFDVNRALSGEK